MESHSELDVATPQILVVEDDPIIRQTLDDVLSTRGHRVRTAATGAEAEERLADTRPDLVILDLVLPDADGLHLCEKVHEVAPDLPIIICSGRSARQDRILGLRLGAVDFVPKPFDIEELLVRVDGALERARRAEELRELAEHDALTGLATRHKGVPTLEDLLLLARRQGELLTVAILDLDRFKEINDTFGHPTGDDVLRYFAAALQRSFRREDLLVRWGGEEFLLGLYGMTSQDAQNRLGEVLASLLEEPLRTRGGGAVRLTFSGGIAHYPDDGDTVEALTRAADSALYRAKAAGRARIFSVTTGAQVPIR